MQSKELSFVEALEVFSFWLLLYRTKSSKQDLFMFSWHTAIS